MAITIIQTPTTPFDMAYGANPITLANLDVAADKYALRVYIVGQADPIADIRQTPNRQGRAIFDIQNVLQTIVGPQQNGIDGINNVPGFGTNERLALSGPTIIEYQIATAEESGGVIPDPGQPGAWTTNPEVFTAMNGSKQYYEVPFDTTPYQVKASGDDSSPPCTVVDRTAQPFSDNNWVIPDELPGLTGNQFSSPAGINVHRVYLDDECTKTFYSPVERDTNNAPQAVVQGIEAFYILQFMPTSTTPVTTNIVPNTQSFGGGPNLNIGSGTAVGGQFQTVTVATGPQNLAATLHPLATYYYVIPVLYGCSDDPQSQTPIMTESAWRAQKYEIAHTLEWGTNPLDPTGPQIIVDWERLDSKCNDYTHVQFAWQNSYGYRDQFTFTKRLNHNVNIKNNNFLKGAADYNSNNYTVDLQDRGYTTYSQKIQNDFEVTSDYMNDEEAELLKHLYQSAEVKVRFASGPYANQWVPVTIQSLRYNQKTIRKDKLFQYTVKFRLASNIKSMRG